MGFQTKYITPDIKLSCYEGKRFKTEVAFDYHMLIWFISGETKILQGDEIHVFRAGDIFLVPRNRLATIINLPGDGEPHKAVAMHLTPERLRTFYASLDVKADAPQTQNIRRFKDHPLLKSCFSSLLPYFELEGPLPENIAALKINEAVSILRAIDADIDGLLADVEKPGKIDLADFMEKNFMFNMPMEKFGYLTGRSLTTFKRDFKKAFRTTPQKWLTQKRLELAHYRLADQHAKPADVYFEVGFENLSHFSHAFKKRFGYPPTRLPQTNEATG